MNRRSFLRLAGLAPLAPLAAKVAPLSHVGEVIPGEILHFGVDFGKPAPLLRFADVYRDFDPGQSLWLTECGYEDVVAQMIADDIFDDLPERAA